MRKLRNTLVLAAACASFSSVGVLSQEYFVTTRDRDKEGWRIARDADRNGCFACREDAVRPISRRGSPPACS